MSVACIFCHACTAFNVNTNIPPRYCVARNSGGGTFTPWAVSRSLSSCSQRPPLPSSRGAAGRLRCIRRRRSGESLNMFDETDLFQLQQWAGEVSAQEVSIRVQLWLSHICGLLFFEEVSLSGEACMCRVRASHSLHGRCMVLHGCVMMPRWVNLVRHLHAVSTTNNPLTAATSLVLGRDRIRDAEAAVGTILLFFDVNFAEIFGGLVIFFRIHGGSSAVLGYPVIPINWFYSTI